MAFKDIIYTDFSESECMFFKIERTHQIPSTTGKKRLKSIHNTMQLKKKTEIKGIKTQKGRGSDFKLKQEKQSRPHAQDQESAWPA